MDNSIFEKILKDKNIERISSEQCLTDYFKKQGHNVFKSAELAQNNISNFVESINLSIQNAKKLNIAYIFLSASKNIFQVNNDYFIVKRIKEKLAILDWKKFELLSSLILEICFGAVETKTTKLTGDGGVDFEGKIPVKSIFSNKIYGFIEIYGQAKRYTNNVGIYEIKSFVAFANSKKRNYVHPAQLFMFFTSSDYAPSSKKELSENGFIGLNGFQLATLIFEHKNQLKMKSDILLELLE